MITLIGNFYGHTMNDTTVVQILYHQLKKLREFVNIPVYVNLFYVQYTARNNFLKSG